MPKNDEGEFELILGNRQLLSVFFIVVILLGVFFTMGYIVGRNSAPLVADLTNSRSGVTPVVESVTPRASTAPAETPTQRTSEPDAASETPAPTPKPSVTKPEIPKPEPARPEPAPAAPKADKAAKSPAAAAGQPVVGQLYLQLAATSKHEADIMVDVLRNKGFKSLAAEIEEKPGIFRVLVGPISEGGANKMRADLQDSGFPGNSAIRRTF